MSPSVVSALAVVLSIIGTILCIVFFLPRKNREKFGKFGAVINDFVNFKKLILEYVLKGLYILSTLFCFFSGFFTIFMVDTTTRSVYNSSTYSTQLQTESSMSGNNVLTGILIMILGPIVIRIVYELFMLMVVAVTNIVEINRKIKGCDKDSKPVEPETPLEPENPTDEEKIVEAAENSSEY